MSARCLIINSYGGSLIIAASDLSLDIIGSYEDAGYGIEIQAENFPRLNYVPKLPWPEQSLKNSIVIAHPPCAAFSVLNKANSSRVPEAIGKDAKKFQCTVDVIKYSLSHNCEALLLESVIPALEGGRAVHDELAREYGYNVFRVLQTAETFGLAQKRPRFWLILTKLDELTLIHRPRSATILDVINKTPDPYNVDPKLDKDTMWQFARAVDAFGLDGAHEVFHSDSYGMVTKLMARKLGVEHDQDFRCVYGVGVWDTDQLKVMDPRGACGVLLASSWWYVRTDEQDGRCLTYDEYNQIMGFPRDYRFPGGTKGRWREYLSRGVCPPVARWLLEQVIKNLDCETKLLTGGHADDVVRIIKSGEVADFRNCMKKATIPDVVPF